MRTHLYATPLDVRDRTRGYALGWSRFSRPYSGNPGWFLFLRLLICLNWAGSLSADEVHVVGRRAFEKLWDRTARSLTHSVSVSVSVSPPPSLSPGFWLCSVSVLACSVRSGLGWGLGCLARLGAPGGEGRRTGRGSCTHTLSLCVRAALPFIPLSPKPLRCRGCRTACLCSLSLSLPALPCLACLGSLHATRRASRALSALLPTRAPFSG